ncbi:hypothetical protein [Deinococcus aquatilis]|uniref:hypothetical protein n=1 Tax=Deinococcus aquatilis TaxID=519440 RepID=UPI0003A5807D|nr:hypothetical protein [Deinococcus aquatilis]
MADLNTDQGGDPMTEILVVMTDNEARKQIESSSLTESEKQLHQAFVDHFPGSRFFANTPEFIKSFEEDEKVSLPKWAAEHLTTLSGAFPAEGSLHFAFSSFQEGSSSPLNEELGHLWFSLDYIGWPSNKRQQKVLKNARKGISLFPIGAEVTDDGYQLAINVAGEDDTTIYQYQINSLMANASTAEEIMASVFPVFQSPGEMLSKVRAIRHGKSTTESTQP